MEEGDLILGRVRLNAYKVRDKQKSPHPVIEMMRNDGATEGEIVVLKVIRCSQLWEN